MLRNRRRPDVTEDTEDLQPTAAPRPDGTYPRHVSHREKVVFSYDPSTDTFSADLDSYSQPVVTGWGENSPDQAQRRVSTWEISPTDDGITSERVDAFEMVTPQRLRNELRREARETGEKVVRADGSCGSGEGRQVCRDSGPVEAAGAGQGTSEPTPAHRDAQERIEKVWLQDAGRRNYNGTPKTRWALRRDVTSQSQPGAQGRPTHDGKRLPRPVGREGLFPCPPESSLWCAIRGGRTLTGLTQAGLSPRSDLRRPSRHPPHRIQHLSAPAKRL